MVSHRSRRPPKKSAMRAGASRKSIALREPGPEAILYERAGPGATAVLDAARLAVSMRRSRSVHLARLREEVDLPLLLIPYLFVRDHGLRVTRMVAEALGQELT